MGKLEIMHAVRTFLFRAFLINIVLVLVCWGFVVLGLVRYFMWALPGFEGMVELANIYIMQFLGIMDILGVVLFLVPTLALTWCIVSEKSKTKQKKKRK